MTSLRAAAVMFAVLAIGGCGDADQPTAAAPAEAKPTTTVDTDASSPDVKEAAAQAGITIDEPEGSERQQLIARLNEIDPRMEDKPDRYVDRAENTCQMLLDNDWSKTRLEQTRVLRFSGGTMPDFSTKQAAQVIEAVRDTFCDGE